MFLNCHTYYSLNYGVMSVSELVEAAASTGIRQLALTDINNTSCAIEFLEKCLDHDIEPVVGIDFRENTQPRYLGLAKSAQGFALLNQLLNQYMVQGIPLPREAPALEDVFFIYDVARMPVRQLRKDEFVGVRPNEIFQVCHGHQLKPDRLVCLLSVTLPATASWELHRLLRCIDLNTILSKLNASSCCQPDEYLRDPKEVARLYATQPFLVRNTKKLLDACCFSLPKDTNPNLSIYLHSAESDFQ
ncbi:MAG: PHP domain-containing protein, partial [Saprospiraceae bacterium]|nr:PHP domain-containing protein [Saprospiraceae bacterium]